MELSCSPSPKANREKGKQTKTLVLLNLVPAPDRPGLVLLTHLSTQKPLTHRPLPPPTLHLKTKEVRGQGLFIPSMATHPL